MLPYPRPVNDYPLTFCWNQADNPLPVKTIQPQGPSAPLPPHLAGPPWLATGATDLPFDFGGHMRRLIADIVERCEVLAHIDVTKLLIGVNQARSARPHGLQARVTPLRFRHGQLTRRRRGVDFQVQRYFLGEQEFLYLVTFCLPRFLDQDFDGKMITIFHELYHIGPSCDGDLRRHDGRYQLHTHSHKEYDRLMGQFAREYLAGRRDSHLHEFLRLNFAQLQERHGAVVGVMVPRPKVVPLLQAAASSVS